MLTIKDFKEGEIAYSVLRNSGCNAKPKISEELVVAVGRTYVTTNNVYTRRYRDFDKEYLLEKAEAGECRLLFKNLQDANDYIEKCDLALWIGRMSVPQAEQYSIEQLRKVKEILD